MDGLSPRTERFPAAILFADISGFTDLSERLGRKGPTGTEELSAIINACFGSMLGPVSRSGGDVLMMAGDALVVAWEGLADGSLREPLLKAVQCAREIQQGSTRTPEGVTLSVRIGIGAGLAEVFYVGGVEGRKNSVRILEAFQQLLTIHPDAQLVIAGGVSLLDHSSTREQFDHLVATNRNLERSVIRTGAVADADMPSLYRLADALIFPSLKEGFGLVVLEAMASGLPVVTSRIAPFTEYLHDNDVIWCDPMSIASIANAMATVLTQPLHARLAQRGILLAHQYDWSNTAQAHLPAYRRLVELQHA